jgi:hypothetical protein
MNAVDPMRYSAKVPPRHLHEQDYMNKSPLKFEGTCGACRYYRDQDQGMGACHRFPPIFAGDQSPRELHHWRFPLVPASSWCGECIPAMSIEMPTAPTVDR